MVLAPRLMIPAIIIIASIVLFEDLVLLFKIWAQGMLRTRRIGIGLAIGISASTSPVGMQHSYTIEVDL